MKTAKSSEIFPIIREILDANGSVCIAVTGTSMYPFLRENIDSVVFKKTCIAEVKRADIVLIIRENGEYVLHRIVRKRQDAFYIMGDNQQWIEGPLKPDQLVAVVSSVWRHYKKINCSNNIWRFLSSVWLYIIPLRGKINSILHRFDGIGIN